MVGKWDVSNNWMSVHPSHHLVLIDGYTHNGPWYNGDSYLSYEDPPAFDPYDEYPSGYETD